MQQEKFLYVFKCSHCEAEHKPIEITIPAGEHFADWQPKCVLCKKETQMRFTRAPIKEPPVKAERPRLPQT